MDLRGIGAYDCLVAYKLSGKIGTVYGATGANLFLRRLCVNRRGVVSIY